MKYIGRVKKRYKILLSVVLFLGVVRIFLPYVLLHYANKSLSHLKGYYGHIEDMDLSILTGAYSIQNMYLNKKDTQNNKQYEFFKVKDVKLSIEWSSIIDGKLVGELKFDSPVLIFTKDKVELSDLKNDTVFFRKLLKDVMPLKVNKFEAFNGDIHYVDNTSQPNLDIVLTETYVLANNLTNVIDHNIDLPSKVTATAMVYGGNLKFNMKLNAMDIKPKFDLNMEVKNTNLVSLNDFLKAYGHFDVHKGTFGLYTEIASKDGKFKGYVKPFIKDLDVIGPEDRKDNFFNRAYEHMIATAAVIVKNPKEQQIATKVMMVGDYNNPKVKTIDAIWEVLRNAFIQALVPKIDNEININSVNAENNGGKGALLKRIFKTGKWKKK